MEAAAAAAAVVGDDGCYGRRPCTLSTTDVRHRRLPGCVVTQSCHAPPTMTEAARATAGTRRHATGHCRQ